ncbi:membrane protein insertase YidC [Mycoplasmopsis opalescens]|uniref:membrane protein insertase YidC n=1 Tax=Mycoplasmopsis opalescens TaxID=114886 RepID=UPI0004A6AB23|nr:membrane protein insertase YidC [Mycoplasmopsis opalescens]
MNQTRSEKFNFFNSGTPGSTNKKEKSKKTWKRIWFWIKVVIYVLLFALTLTGCVQSFVIRSSSFTGAGTEFYTSKEKIAPLVASYQKSTKSKSSCPSTDGKKATKHNVKLKDGQFISYEYNTDINYHLAYKNFKDELEALQKQTKADDGEYGKIKSTNSAIQFVNEKQELENKNQPIYALGEGAQKRYLYLNSTSTKYTSIYNQNYSNIQTIDSNFKFENLFYYDKLTDTYRKQGHNYIIVSKFKDSENKDQEKAYHVKSVGVFFKPELAANNPSLIYARDILETLYKKTFVENTYYTDVLGTPEEINKLIKGVADGNVYQLSPDKYHALNNYITTLNAYLKNVGFEQLKANPDKTSFGHEFTKLDSKLPHSEAEQIAFYSYKSVFPYGPFFWIFSYPIGFLTASLRENAADAGGWTTVGALVLAVLITRIIVLAFTWKATVTQSRQEDLRVKKAKIDAKYAEFQNNKQMKQRQQMEIQELYKKHGVNPFDSFLSILIAFPVFFAMWRVIQSIPEMKSTHWLGMSFSATSYKQLFNGEWQYLWILIVSAVVQVLSQFMPRILTYKKAKQRTTVEEKAAMRKSNRMQYIMMVMFVFMSVAFSCGVQVYWILTSTWQIIQTITIHYIKRSDWFRKKYAVKPIL